MASGGESRLRRAVKKIGFSCTIFSTEVCFRDPHKNISSPRGSPEKIANGEEVTADGESNPAKIYCTICLEPLDCKETEQAVFTAQCMHSFHFTCISSNVRHGSVTCPICRAHWTRLPRDISPFRTPPGSQASDPILRILDDSIATFRVHRRSSLRSSRYDDDEAVDTDSIAPRGERLQMTLVPIPVLPASPETLPNHPLQFSISPPPLAPQQNATFGYCLSIKLSQQQATDVVLVVSPNGPHLRLLKQAMFLVVFSLRPPDRLAIVTYSSSATRALPLRRMTSSGKRASLQVINRMFYLGEADPIDGVRKGIKILEDRRYQNPLCCILHLSDGPTRSYISRDIEVPIPIHRFHIGFGYGASNEFAMHEFEEFVLRLLGGVVRETQLRIGEQGGLIRIGELRGGEERRIPLGLIGESEYVCVGYSYIEEGVEECPRNGEIVVGFAEKSEQNGGGCGQITSMDSGDGRSRVAASRWDYIDPFMARRWARHLHGYRN